MKVFVDTDSDERLARRLRRDITQRGRSLKVSDCFSFLILYSRCIYYLYSYVVIVTVFKLALRKLCNSNVVFSVPSRRYDNQINVMVVKTGMLI